MMFESRADWGDQHREYHLGMTHAHDFFTPRNLYVLATLSKQLSSLPYAYQHVIRFLITASFNRITNLVRYMPQYKERNVGPLSGTLYKPALFGEINPFNVLKAKVSGAARGLSRLPDVRAGVITVQSSDSVKLLDDNTVDYVFTDPPFGDNLPYAELNFLEELWLGVLTNKHSEAIISDIQKKDLWRYQELMKRAFRENFRVLKPGRWMTVVFHNSQNRIWNAIQEAVLNAGFVVADVRILDKQRGTTKQQVYTSGAVRQDLVISCYKPSRYLEERFSREAGSESGAWEFIRSHLLQLPVFVIRDDEVEPVSERQDFLLFDRMVAFHVQRSVTVPLSAAEFYAGLAQRFSVRDGMYFLPEQAVEYDRKRMTVKGVMQLDLFVRDEDSAIQWLKQQLSSKPQTFQELHPQFTRELGGWQKHEKPLELLDLLQENFLCYDGKSEVPSQIHSYLSSNFKELRNLPKTDERLRAKAKDRWYVADPSKAEDLEKLRDRALLREFEEYRTSSQKKLKVFRLEAVRAGFKKAWQERDYATIISVAQKIPDNVLQEDPKLLMWYDQAMTRRGEQQCA